MANTVVTATGTYKLTPLHDRLLVKRIKENGKNRLIWTPSDADRNSQKAEVISLGPECTDLEVGDTVLLPGIAATYPDWETCDYMLIQQADVGGILT